MADFPCSKCGGSDVVRRGKRYNRIKVKQLYRCNNCGSTFVEPDGFERMRHEPEDIVRAVHQHVDGLSLFKVKTHLWQHEGVKVSMQTINQWTNKYGSFLKSASRKREAKN